MAYKRPAHIIFFSGENTSRAWMATCLANQLGTGWMEAHACALSSQSVDSCVPEVMAEIGVAGTPQAIDVLNEALLEWADLVVTLDAEADRLCPALPAGVQKRCYAFVDPVPAGSAAAYREMRDAIRQRIEGMIAGMKMLSRDARE